MFFLAATVLGAACSGLDSGAGSPLAECGTAEFESLPVVLDPLDTLTASNRAEVVELLTAAGHYEGREWQVVSDDGNLVLFGSPTDSNFPYGHATFSREDDSLVLEVANNCNLQFNSEGLSIASFRLDPSQPLDPESRQVPVLFTEKACAGGGALAGREVRPSVVEMTDRIEIVVFVEAPQGPQSCPGNSEVSWTVELESPVGSRTIADASAIPSRRVN
ncbi:MAG: hypothetical protein AAF962_25365 [Actinomycetota bacterium]